jgi:hypothetical protein
MFLNPPDQLGANGWYNLQLVTLLLPQVKFLLNYRTFITKFTATVLKTQLSATQAYYGHAAFCYSEISLINLRL